ncbi:hypothetical protein AM587_10013466 [Phytophthora nicotianae]|uniref:Protein kinase domain-containing protein n=1 Tax=Phytophthora nicotianae TaxID=4792 RepID=A0A0W8BQ47_PHYNI|nr:hypothetical protein AM587_10013466 [Phytophthora nicotianae]
MSISVTQVMVLLVTVIYITAPAIAMDAMQVFSRGVCVGAPNTLIMKNSEDCEDNTCKRREFGDDPYNVSVNCNISDRFDHAAEVFTYNYVVIEYYDQNTSCNSDNLTETDVYPGTRDCQVASINGTSSVMVYLYTNGSVDVFFFKDDVCGGNSNFNFTLSGAEVANGDCIKGGYKVYTSYSLSATSSSSSGNTAVSQLGRNASSSSGIIASSSSNKGAVPVTTSKGSGVNIGAIAGVVAGVIVAVLLIVIGFLWYRRRSKRAKGSPSGGNKVTDGYATVTSPTTGQKSTDSDITDFSSSLGVGPRSLAGLWDDEAIATARIPREKLEIQQLISRGGYGEIYFGFFIGKCVAIKTLLPELRKSVKHVNGFLDEVRLLARLDHPRIVQFVGIAWNTLADLCFVLEYMEGGDLHALLATYEAQNFDTGFDKSKVTIALHVAHGLTYLHSLDPPVLHRDLKSKNILLSSELEAKITDFGTSRERGERTMTAGVGTSLWMAPEVMLGQRYDHKSDIFSFGVVLSELDQHKLPYSHAKGRKLPDTALLQMVALGTISVEFSSGTLESMVQLGKSCVAVDPDDRPTAAEALYQLQLILRQEL